MPDGAFVYTVTAGAGDRVALGTMEGRVEILGAGGSNRRVLSERGGWVVKMGFDDLGRRLAVASKEGVIRLWDLEDPSAPARSLEVPIDIVHALAFHPTEARLASGSEDGMIRVWDTESGRQLLTLLHGDEWVIDLAFDPESQALVSASQKERMRVWNVRRSAGRRSLDPQ
jgi:WD40 repeat protein